MSKELIEVKFFLFGFVLSIEIKLSYITIFQNTKTRRFLCLFKQIHSILMEDVQYDYMLKQHDSSIDAMTDKVTELYRTQEITEKKLDGILVFIVTDPDKVHEISRNLQVYTRKDKLDALSGSMKAWTAKIENVAKN